MADFLIKYNIENELGMITSTHEYMANNLEGGLSHPDALKLAKLQSKAVDAAKSGQLTSLPKGASDTIQLTCKIIRSIGTYTVTRRIRMTSIQRIQLLVS